VTNDGLNAMTYDAENRLAASSNANSGLVTYYYDGDGRRVQKVVTGGATTTYVYDAQGQLAAEYATSAPPALCATCWLTADHLGSTRMLTDSNGTVQRRYDFLPFGEEIPQGINGRTAPYEEGLQLTTPDTTDVKFTAKSRDSESGLDFFGARYFSGAQGRFTSPDPKTLTSHFNDPQSWNKYVYTRNNPLMYVDPDGKDFAQAWADVQKFAASLYAKASVGVGYEVSVKAGPLEAKGGIAANANVNAENRNVGLSTSVDVGVSVGLKDGPRIGESASADKSLVKVNTENGKVTGPEEAKGEVTDTLGVFGGNVNSNSDKVGLGATCG
jgi:RHS repeat-associated protein